MSLSNNSPLITAFSEDNQISLLEQIKFARRNMVYLCGSAAEAVFQRYYNSQNGEQLAEMILPKYRYIIDTVELIYLLAADEQERLLYLWPEPLRQLLLLFSRRQRQLNLVITMFQDTYHSRSGMQREYAIARDECKKFNVAPMFRSIYTAQTILDMVIPNTVNSQIVIPATN